MFPACTLRPRQALGGARSGAGTAVHAASSVWHCRGLTLRAEHCLKTGGLVGVSIAAKPLAASISPRSTALPLKVETGLERLIRDDFAPLRGQKIGLVTNPTGVDSRLRTNIEVLHSTKKLKLVKLFGPEHGVRGDASAGAEIGNSVDPITQLPVYSLYGKSKRPSMEMLAGLDALVFDIQDIGARSYTYISTMGLCMEACAEFGVPFYVLDRPNPAGGNRVEGNLLDTKFRSFIGRYQVPYLHGMTLGEMSTYLNSTGKLEGGGGHGRGVTRIRRSFGRPRSLALQLMVCRGSPSASEALDIETHPAATGARAA